jgi:hypothetical protein
MNRLRAIGFKLLLCLALVAFFTSAAYAQTDIGQSGGSGNGNGGGAGGRRGQGGVRNRDPLPDQSAGTRVADPTGRDAVELYSRICVSTRGNRAQAVGIIGEGDSAIEKLTDGMLRGLENGKPGGIGWIVRMPLGDRIVVEFTGDDTCIVRAPRVAPSQIEGAFQDLLEQYSASGQFDVRRGGEQTKSFDPPDKQANAEEKTDERHKDANKLKIHFISYTMKMPDTGRIAELGIATTDSRTVQIQATLTYLTRPLTSEATVGKSLH